MNDKNKEFFFSIDQSDTKFYEQNYAVKNLGNGFYKISVATINPYVIKPNHDFNDVEGFSETIQKIKDFGKERYPHTSDTQAFEYGLRRIYMGHPADSIHVDQHTKHQDMLVYDAIIDTNKMRQVKRFSDLSTIATDFGVRNIKNIHNIHYNYNNYSTFFEKRSCSDHELESLDCVNDLVNSFIACRPVYAEYQRLSERWPETERLGKMFVLGTGKILQHLLRSYAVEKDIPLIANNFSHIHGYINHLVVVDETSDPSPKNIDSICVADKLADIRGYFNACQMQMFASTGAPLMDTESSQQILDVLSKFTTNKIATRFSIVKIQSAPGRPHFRAGYNYTSEAS